MRNNRHAHLPTRGSLNAAGLDLYSVTNAIVPAKDRLVIDTGIRVKMPCGSYGRIAARSGLAVKHGIDVGAGVIDEDYTGPIKIVLFNHSKEDFQVRIGDRIAQLICEKNMLPHVVEYSDLRKTQRGGNGFGSSGVNNENLLRHHTAFLSRSHS